MEVSMTRHYFSARFPLLFSLVVLIALTASATVRLSGPTQGKDAPKVSEGETKAAGEVETAPDAAAKVAAATTFASKYPKSTLRPKVAQHVGIQISMLTDPVQKVKLAEDLQRLFQGPGELEIVRRVVIDAYASADKLDEALPWRPLLSLPIRKMCGYSREWRLPAPMQQSVRTPST
jgi:hypothetical protein